GAHGRHLGDAPPRSEPFALPWLSRPVCSRQNDIATEQQLAMLLEAAAQRVGERSNGCDHHHAEGNAGDENVKAGYPASKLPQSQPQDLRCWRPGPAKLS